MIFIEELITREILFGKAIPLVVNVYRKFKENTIDKDQCEYMKKSFLLVRHQKYEF